VKETRRYIITSSGEKQYITDADIQNEAYCDQCSNAFGPQEDYIYLQIRGGWNKKAVSIPGYSEVMLLHEDCTPNMIMHMMKPVPKITTT
jgi:hypothetical protein